MRLNCEYFDGNSFFGFDLELRAQIPHTNNQILQDGHLGLGGFIDLVFVGLRI